MLPVNASLLPTVSRFFDDDWNTLFDWRNRNFNRTTSSFPSANIRETPDNFIVELAAPGLTKKDFQIELHNDTLTIKSSMKEEKEEKDTMYTRKEFNYHSFERSFNLNNHIVDEGKIKASYNNGILMLTIPKKDEAKEKPARLISIS